jgi:anaerobic selenocysteine-containing dehydrogenase
MPTRISRRDFIRIGVAGAASAVLTGCQPARRYVNLEPYVRPPEEQIAGEATWYASTCRMCPAGCGIVVRIMNGRALKIEGNPEHPLNRGKLCARGHGGLQLLYNPDRLTGPVQQARRGSREFKPLTWDDGINALAARLQAAGGAVAVWCGAATSGHMLDAFRRYTAAVGAPDPLVYDLYSAREGYRALRAGQKTATGREELPALDVAHADTVFSFGADFLGTHVSSTRYGIEYGALRRGPQGKRGYLVQFEPRMSITAAKADHWVPVRPGAEGLVAQALVRLIADNQLGGQERAARAAALAGTVDIGAVVAAADVSLEELQRLARVFAEAVRPVAMPGGALSGQSNGADILAAVHALNAVAGTAGMLADGPTPAGLVKPAPASSAEAQAMVERLRLGQVQVLLVYDANPAYDLPEKAGFADALGHVPFVVSFASLVDETAVQADLTLPDRTYLESWGYEVVAPNFGTPIVGSQQPVVTPVFDARATTDVLLAATRNIPDAAQALPWADEAAFLKETVAGLPPEGVGGATGDLAWARFLQLGGWWTAAAQSAPTTQPITPAAPQAATPTYQGDAANFPYYLHLYLTPLLGGGRGASIPWLQGSPDPMTTISWRNWVEIHPTLAQKLGVQNGDIVQVTSPEGQVEAPVYVYRAVRPDTIAMPLGQGHTDSGRYARDRGTNPLRLLGMPAGGASDLAWSTVRVQVKPTGNRIPLPVFESNEGMIQSDALNPTRP